MNWYHVDGDRTIIYLDRADGSAVETIIDTDDLEHVLSFGRKWFSSESGGRTVASAHTVGNEETVYLSRWILGITDSETNVDYLNHNALDNRRTNLALTKSGSGLFRADVNKNNTSGYLGVTWNEQARKWLAQITHKRKNHYLGTFDDAEEAARVVERKREELLQLERVETEGNE